MNSDREQIERLIGLSHEIGQEARQLAILGEGNTSCCLGDSRFAVKASGTSLATLTEADVTVCEREPLARLLEGPDLSDTQIKEALMGARVEPSAKRPSVEAMFHAWLLSLDGIEFVGHCHPVTVNQVLCSPRAEEFAMRRIFPDQVVYCGEASVFVPYVDPGLVLAREIRDRTLAFRERVGRLPRVILLANHGVIAIGPGPESVMASLLMTSKAAAIFVGAACLGGPRFMEEGEIQRIAGRPDEHYRQQQMRL